MVIATEGGDSLSNRSPPFFSPTYGLVSNEHHNKDKSVHPPQVFTFRSIDEESEQKLLKPEKIHEHRDSAISPPIDKKAGEESPRFDSYPSVDIVSLDGPGVDENVDGNFNRHQVVRASILRSSMGSVAGGLNGVNNKLSLQES